MSTQEQIGRLQGLLERIKRNAGAPRVSASVTAVPAPAYAEPEPAPPRAALTSAADQSVDDLLGVSAQPSQPPEVEVSLESFAPPPVESDAPAYEAPEAEPIPLLSVTAPQAELPSTEDAFSLESEVSEVRVATGVREPAVEVTVAAIEAEAEQLQTEELSEDDLVEVTEGTPLPAATASDVDIDFEDEEEQPPASSQRKVATTMDEALADAAAQFDSEREVPLKTPPPESGPQEAPAYMPAPPAPDVDSLLGAELDIPTREAHAVPTTEQLGQTIDLEEARGPSLELAERGSDAPAAAPVEELEMALPAREANAGYDDNLAPPPEARDELEAHRRRLEEDIPPPPESLAQLPSVQPGPPIAEIIPLQTAPVENMGPEVVARPISSGSPEAFASVRESFRPSSFAELLDASLSLDGN